MNLKYRFRLVLLFLAASALAVGLIYWRIDIIRETEILKLLQYEKTQLESVIAGYHQLADTFYDTHESPIAALLYTVLHNHMDPQEARRRMYDQTIAAYDSMVMQGWRQLHVHLPGGVSFLRFHKPDQSGDMLTDIRPSLEQINRDYRFQTGYEIGKYVGGIRYIYPLFYNGVFVGTIEWGLTFHALASRLYETDGDNHLFIIDRKALEQKVVADSVLQYYAPFSIDKRFYVNITDIPDGKRVAALKQSLQTPLTPHALLRSNRPFVEKTFFNHQPYAAIWLPIQEITGPTIAMMATLKPDSVLHTLEHTWFLESLLAILTIAIFFYAGARKYQQKAMLANLLNLQQNMVFVTTGTDMQLANRTLLDYFGYASLSALKKAHSCICDFFINENNALTKEVNGINWVNFVLTHPNKRHLAVMKDRQGEKHTFLVLASNLEESSTLVSFTDITSIDEETRELADQATHDPLTGLWNRRKFEEQLSLERKRAERYQSTFCLVMFDIDHFKNFNDTYGHDMGDCILQALSGYVGSHIRSSDILARWGGEEFVLIQPHTDQEACKMFCENIRAGIGRRSFCDSVKITCSFGIAEYKSGEAEQTLLKRADAAMYRSKQEGRNRISIA